ncbi:carboxypeptidase regulatory-like domain-containing protein [Fervidibacter sp.]
MRKGIVVEAGKTTEVVIVAPKEPTKTVSGQVLDEEGKPLANVMVRVRGRANASVSGFVPHAYADTPTDNEGRINFAVQEPGHYSLTIQVDGYEPAKVDGLVVGDEKVAPEFVVRLKRAKELKGAVEVQVLSANGSPVKDVWVTPVKKQGEGAFEWEWLIDRGQFSDKNGLVRFNDLPAGDYIFVGIPPSDRLPVAISPTVTVASAEKVKVTISVPATGRIVGKLVDEKGNPIAGEFVSVWKEDETQEERLLGYNLPTAVTKSDGSFTLENLPEGSYIISTSFGVAVGLVTTWQNVYVRKGETAKATVTVISEMPTVSITGEVIDSSGKPVSGATVLVNSEPMLRAVTDENGRFSFSEIPAFRYNRPATYSVTVMKPGFASRSETVKIEGGKSPEVRLMLEPGALIEGQLVSEKGEPVGGMPVYAVPEELACAG